jgi:hypothetical protein
MELSIQFCLLLSFSKWMKKQQHCHLTGKGSFQTFPKIILVALSDGFSEGHTVSSMYAVQEDGKIQRRQLHAVTFREFTVSFTFHF